jgi:hypothetical protein
LGGRKGLNKFPNYKFQITNEKQKNSFGFWNLKFVIGISSGQFRYMVTRLRVMSNKII